MSNVKLDKLKIYSDLRDCRQRLEGYKTEVTVAGMKVYVSVKHGMIFIDFNPSLYNRQHNLYAADKEDLSGIINAVLIELRRTDIDLKIERLKVSRIDLCVTFLCSADMHFIELILRRIHPSGLEPNKYKTGLTMKNKSFSILFYDKISELQKNNPGMNLDEFDGKNLIRCELALQNERKVKYYCGGNNSLLNILDNIDTDKLFDEIIMKKFFNKIDMADMNINNDIGSELDCFARWEKLFKPGGKMTFLSQDMNRHNWTSYIDAHFNGDIKKFESAVLHFIGIKGLPEQAMKRKLARIKESVRKELWQHSPDDFCNGLYRELHEALIGNKNNI